MAVKVVVLVTRRPGLEASDFRLAWHYSNPARVATIPGLLRYRQTPAIAELHRSCSYDGMAELWFASLDTLRTGLRSVEADAVRRHEETFIGHLEWFIADTFIDFHGPYADISGVHS